MNKINLIVYSLFAFLILSCVKNKVDGVYSTEGGPYFKFTKNQYFEFGIPNDENPLRGTFTIKGNTLDLIGNTMMMGNNATTNFICSLSGDTLSIDVLQIKHPKFEIFISKPDNYAKTVRDTITTEMKLNDPEAEQELFIYYKLVFDKFIKRNGG